MNLTKRRQKYEESLKDINEYNMQKTTIHPYLFAGLRPAFKQPIIDSSKPVTERMIDITLSVCEYYKVKLSDAVSSMRKGEVVRARQIAMYLIRNKTTATLSQIGGFFGNRDHTTVIYSVQLVDDYIETDKAYKADILKLKDKTRLL